MSQTFTEAFKSHAQKQHRTIIRGSHKFMSYAGIAPTTRRSVGLDIDNRLFVIDESSTS